MSAQPETRDDLRNTCAEAPTQIKAWSNMCKTSKAREVFRKILLVLDLSNTPAKIPTYNNHGPQQQWHFFKLPAELRQEILQYAFADAMQTEIIHNLDRDEQLRRLAFSNSGTDLVPRVSATHWKLTRVFQHRLVRPVTPTMNELALVLTASHPLFRDDVDYLKKKFTKELRGRMGTAEKVRSYLVEHTLFPVSFSANILGVREGRCAEEEDMGDCGGVGGVVGVKASKGPPESKSLGSWRARLGLEYA